MAKHFKYDDVVPQSKWVHVLNTTCWLFRINCEAVLYSDIYKQRIVIKHKLYGFAAHTKYETFKFRNRKQLCFWLDNCLGQVWVTSL